MKKQKELTDLVASIYTAAVDSAHWQNVGEELADIVGGHQSTIFLFDDLGSSERPLVVSYCDPSVIFQFEEILHEDVWLKKATALPTSSVFRSEEFIDLREYRKTRFFQEVCVPADVAHMTGSVVVNDQNQFICFAIQRGERRGMFDSKEIARVALVRDHFQRALTIHRTIGKLRSEVSSLRAVLDTSSVATFLVDADGVTIWWNQAAERLLRKNDGVLIRNQRLMLHFSDDRSALRRLISSTTKTTKQEGTSAGGMIAARRPSGTLPYKVTVSPLQSVGGVWGDNAASAIFIVDPEQAAAMDEQALQTVFGLTPTEARITAKLTLGARLPDLADLLEISHNTARTHLKSIFRKCRVKSQAQLVARIASTS